MFILCTDAAFSNGQNFPPSGKNAKDVLCICKCVWEISALLKVQTVEMFKEILFTASCRFSNLKDAIHLHLDLFQPSKAEISVLFGVAMLKILSTKDVHSALLQ